MKYWFDEDNLEKIYFADKVGFRTTTDGYIENNGYPIISIGNCIKAIYCIRKLKYDELLEVRRMLNDDYTIFKIVNYLLLIVNPPPYSIILHDIREC